MALATSNIVPKYPSLTSSLGNKGLIKPSTTTQTTTPQTISSNPLGKVLPALGSIANIGGSSSNIYQNMPTNAPNTSMNPAASPVPNASSSVMGVVSPKTPTPVSPSVYNINGSGMGANTSNPNFSGVSGGTAGTPVVQTPQPPQTQQQNTFLVKNNQTGEVSNMTPDQYNLNKDNFSLASATKPGEIAGLGTQNQDTSSYQALIQQAADAQAAARNFNQNLTNAKTAVTQTGSDLPFQTGAQEGLNRQYGAQAQALATAAQNATQLAGLAAPQLASYSQQAFNPLTGQFSGGGSLQEAVSGVVQKLQSGQMSYNDALTALSGYGQGGVNALQQALPQGFNVAQSNVLAGQQGAIGPAYSYAKTAITNLQNAVSQLATGQNTNIPIINQITQGLSTTFGVGSQAVQAYKGALAEARSAIQKVLASVQGGTPTDYVGQSNALLPDNATPNQIAAASQTLDTLGQAKVDIYGNPGQSGTSGTNTMFGSFFQ